jgi:hypothetical protein
LSWWHEGDGGQPSLHQVRCVDERREDGVGCVGGCALDGLPSMPTHPLSPCAARAGPATMTAPSRFAIVSGMAAAFTGPCPCRNKRNALVAILITVLMPMVRCCGGIYMRAWPRVDTERAWRGSLRTRIREQLRHTMTCGGGSPLTCLSLYLSHARSSSLDPWPPSSPRR